MVDPALIPEPDAPVRPPSTARRLALGLVALVVGAAFLGMQLLPSRGGTPDRAPKEGVARAAGGDTVTVLGGEPASIDPARHGDAGSAAVVAQLFETLTAFDPGLTLRPALAESWRVEDEGRRVVFTLREGLAFSDGGPLRAEDVVRSWLRLVDPDRPSPLASLLSDVRGVDDVLAGTARDTSGVGIAADGERRVIVELERPAGDLPAIVSAPPFGIVPPGVGTEVTADPDGWVGSGGYVLAGVDSDALVLRANPRYWAGEPAIATVRYVTDIAGASPVETFEDGGADVAAVADFDARWIAYDATLGPQLRSSPSLSVNYYGFDASRPPFDDVRVRQAFALAVDWRRLAALDEPGSTAPASGIVPAGIPGRPEGDFLPRHNPDEARLLLADAGYPGGRGFPATTLVTSGGGYDEAVVAEIEAALGIRLGFETMDFDEYTARLETDPPAMWALSWVADYPGPNDFLGVLLRTGSTANYGRWSDAEFDAAIADARSAADPEAATSAYARALELVRERAPVVPVSYGVDWSLTRDGLLGATENGLGNLRFAGLAWRDGS